MPASSHLSSLPLEPEPGARVNASVVGATTLSRGLTRNGGGRREAEGVDFGAAIDAIIIHEARARARDIWP
jgi:hypothetical protein